VAKASGGRSEELGYMDLDVSRTVGNAWRSAAGCACIQHTRVLSSFAPLHTCRLSVLSCVRNGQGAHTHPHARRSRRPPGPPVGPGPMPCPDDNDNDIDHDGNELTPRPGGLSNAYGIAHEQFMWDIKQEPAVVDKFEQIWDTKELIVSFGE
jgi:hypothetical protein